MNLCRREENRNNGPSGNIESKYIHKITILKQQTKQAREKRRGNVNVIIASETKIPDRSLKEAELRVLTEVSGQSQWQYLTILPEKLGTKPKGLSGDVPGESGPPRVAVKWTKAMPRRVWPRASR
jgi:predicted nuclease of restriction endonuclease-like RecB superfamily